MEAVEREVEAWAAAAMEMASWEVGRVEVAEAVGLALAVMEDARGMAAAVMARVETADQVALVEAMG